MRKQPRAYTMTWGDFEALPAEERRAVMRDLLSHWQGNTRDQAQADIEADQRAYALGLTDDAEAIDRPGAAGVSGTNRNPRL